MNAGEVSIESDRGEGGSPPRGNIKQARFRKGALAIVCAAVLAVATVESCIVTRNGDGTIRIEFAPDMVITAWGLEDALRQMADLYRQCLAGTWQRPCTRDELAGIERMHERILNVKEFYLEN